MSTLARPLAMAVAPSFMGFAIGLTAVLLPWASMSVLGLWLAAGCVVLRRAIARQRRRRIGALLGTIAALIAASAICGLVAGLNAADGHTAGWWTGPTLGIAAFFVTAARARNRQAAGSHRKAD